MVRSQVRAIRADDEHFSCTFSEGFPHCTCKALAQIALILLAEVVASQPPATLFRRATVQADYQFHLLYGSAKSLRPLESVAGESIVKMRGPCGS